jgi:hypothetical protein
LPKAVYKNQTVSVLEQDPKFSKIFYEGGDEFDAFTVRTPELKEYREPKTPVSPRPQVTPGQPMAAQITPSDWATFASYCSQHGYRLFVQENGMPGQRDLAVKEYADWTGGQVLPDDCILPGGQGVGATGKKTGFHREWIVETEYTDGMPSPVEILEAGSVGRGRQNRDAQGNIEPVGMRTSLRKVRFQYREVAKQLCQQGLRATIE